MLNTDIFIERSISIHGDKYDYSKSIYTSARKNITITCRIHGDFEQRASHHTDGSGCKKCADSERSKNKLSQKEVIARFKNKHGEKYDYSLVSYLSVKHKIKIICPVHGVFEQTASDHFVSGCKKCGTEVTTNKSRRNNDEFIRISKSIHGDWYIYDKAVYTTANNKVKIGCRVHGYFNQIACDHYIGKGCIKCGYIKSIRKKKREIGFNGYTKTKYVEMASKNHNGKSNIYIIKASSLDGEIFYKIGISMYSVKKRFASHFPYNIDEFIEVSMDAGIAWSLEKEIHRKLKKHSYKPKLKFGGYTECFSYVPDDIFDMIKA